MKDDQEIKIGDVVKLKSGSRHMTVTARNASGKWECSFHEKGKPESEEYASIVLAKVEGRHAISGLKEGMIVSLMAGGQRMTIHAINEPEPPPDFEFDMGPDEPPHNPWANTNRPTLVEWVWEGTSGKHYSSSYDLRSLLGPFDD